MWLSSAPVVCWNNTWYYIWVQCENRAYDTDLPNVSVNALPYLTVQLLHLYISILNSSYVHDNNTVPSIVVRWLQWVCEERDNQATGCLVLKCLGMPFKICCGNTSEYLLELYSSKLLIWSSQQFLSKRKLPCMFKIMNFFFLFKKKYEHLKDVLFTVKYACYWLAESLRFLCYSLWFQLALPRVGKKNVNQWTITDGIGKKRLITWEEHCNAPNHVSVDAIIVLLMRHFLNERTVIVVKEKLK